MRLLKNNSGQIIQLFIGSTTLTLVPDQIVEYSSIVIEDAQSYDYNVPLIKDYLDNNILTLITDMPKAVIPEVLASEVIVNFGPTFPLTIVEGTTITFTNLTSIDIDNEAYVWSVRKKSTQAEEGHDITFVNSTSATSKNPKIKFLFAETYSVGLLAINTLTGKTGSLIKENLIKVNLFIPSI